MKNLFVCFLLLSSQLTFAGKDCEFDLTFSQVTAQVLDTEQVLLNSINLYRGKDPPGRCSNYRLFFSKGSAQSYQRVAKFNGSNVSYNLHNNINKAGILKEQPDALGISEWVDFNAPNRETNYSANFFVSIPGFFTQNFPPKGTYTDNINVVVWVVKNGNYDFDETTSLAVSIIVPTRLDISLVDEGGTFDASSLSKVFDFGAITQNQIKSADIVVRSNTPYQLKMSSQNGGKLKLGSSSTIGYLITSNGSNVGVTTPSTEVIFGSGSGNSGVSGDRFNIKVQINEGTSSKAAGLYEDVVTITAVAN